MRKYIKANAHLRAMVSRIKYYRRRKAENLKIQRRQRNFSYYIYIFKNIVRKFYIRSVKFHKLFDTTTTPIQQNLLFISKKRATKFDDDEENEEEERKYPSVGLYYTINRTKNTYIKLLNTFSTNDGIERAKYGKFSNSIQSLHNNKVSELLKKVNYIKFLTINRILGTNFIRYNYNTLYRMDRMKFPLVKYRLLPKTVKTLKKISYYFRKMSSLLIKKDRWYKKFKDISLWQYHRILRLKIVNKIKINIHKTYNNFYITAVRNNNNVILSYSAGCSGLAGSKRMSPVSAEKVAKKFINKFFDRLSIFVNVDIYLNCKRIDGAIRNILNILTKTKKIHYSKYFKRRILIKLLVNNLILNTTRTHNGVRKRHTRRV